MKILRLSAITGAFLSGYCFTAAAATSPEELTKVAELALQRGDCRLASDSYASAMKGPSVEVAKRATEVSLGCDQFPAAFNAATRWRSLAPEDERAAALYTVSAVRLGRVADARAELGTVAARDRNPEKLIDLLALQQDAPIAQLAVEGVFGATPRSTAVPTALGELALASADFAKAEQQAKSALARDPKHLPALKLLARVLALEGKADAALAVAATAAAAGDETQFVPAETLMTLDRIEEARGELEKLRAHGAPEPEVNKHLAMLAYQSGDWDEAQQRFGELARQDATTELAVFYLSELAQRTGDPEAALAGYKHLINSPLGFEAAKRAAMLLADKQDRSGAFTLLDAYTTKHPEQRFEALVAKIDIVAGSGDAKVAMQMIDAAEREYRGSPVLAYERATVLEKVGRTRDSIRSFEKLLATRPQDPALKNALGYTMGEHGIDLPKAEALVRSALDVMPDSPAALDSLGWIRYRRGDAADAAQWLARAYRVGKDGEIAAHWGEAVWASGQEGEARRIWATALARDPNSTALEAAIAKHSEGGAAAGAGAGSSAPSAKPSRTRTSSPK